MRAPPTANPLPTRRDCASADAGLDRVGWGEVNRQHHRVLRHAPVLTFDELRSCLALCLAEVSAVRSPSLKHDTKFSPQFLRQSRSHELIRTTHIMLELFTLKRRMIGNRHPFPFGEIGSLRNAFQ